ncbi:MlaD family protein [Amycolatopsis circi]|uniref:MlaD family protein n=1 Tax=Amycolatopsis circi TaxID=871959 RepID=UPI000E2552F4|nr:MlaD family protein [Amycolatopsis circi]
MRIPHAVLPVLRLVMLLAFVLVCALVFGYLWVSSGGKLPVVSQPGYQVVLHLDKASNLVKDSDVMVAGVKVGKVDQLSVQGGKADVVLQLEKSAPLHQGATVQVRAKTLINETFLEITDGRGQELASGTVLPDSAGKPATELNDVLASLDPGTRNALASSVRSLGAATKDGKASISQALQGLGDLGREGKTTLDALAGQSEDLKHLMGSTTTLLAALDTRQGEIGQLVDNANQLVSATSGNSKQLEDVLRKLPGLMDTARTATGSLNKVSGALSPVAANLNIAAPDLSAALKELPQTSADLRALLPSLNGVLAQAPATLQRVPAVAQDVRNLVPALQVDLSDLNPMLGFLRPYGHDLAAFFTNFAQTLATGDANGRAFRVFSINNEQTLKGNPLNTNIGPLNKFNAYPLPGSATNPGPANNPYPHVQPEPPK